MTSGSTTGPATRRLLRFEDGRELWAEVERIAAAERAGTLQHAGNWSAGQTFGHLATWIDYSYDGYPANLKAPWILRFILRIMKRRFLNGPMRSGVKIPGVPGGTLGVAPLSLDEGLTALRSAWARLEAAPTSLPNIILGPLTHAEQRQLALRHAELHLGFLSPT